MKGKTVLVAVLMCAASVAHATGGSQPTPQVIDQSGSCFNCTTIPSQTINQPQGGQGGDGGNASNTTTVTANPVAYGGGGGNASATGGSVSNSGNSTSNSSASQHQGQTQQQTSNSSAAVTGSGNSNQDQSQSITGSGNSNQSQSMNGSGNSSQSQSVSGSGNSTNNSSGNVSNTGNVSNAGNVDLKIDSHDKNLNVMLVPPSTPSLAPAPVIAECATCFVDYLYSILESCGSTGGDIEVYKGKQLFVAKDVFPTMTTMSGFPGLRKERGSAKIVAAVANRVPDQGTYECLASVSVQAAGKEAHMVTVDELRIRAAQVGQYLRTDETLLMVMSRKATIMHATLATTGRGWSIAPGAGGPLGEAIGSVTGTLGRSSGTATNDWTPELTVVFLRQKAGTGVTSNAFATMEKGIQKQ